MKRAIVVMAAVALATAVFSAGLPVGAHVADRFSLCASQSRTGGSCRRSALFVNDSVWLRGKVKPPHSDKRAIILRRDEGEDQFRRVGSAGINNRGIIRWRWDPVPEDQGEYVFRMRIRGHGRSNTVDVEYVFCPACPG